MCTRPLKGWAAHGGGFTYNVNRGWKDRPLTIPCGKCIECKGVARFEKAIRTYHTLETEPGRRGCFVTLTYDQEHLPSSGELQLEHLQKFLKRVRHKMPRRVSYLAAGEYGSKGGRPHYHLCLVGYEPKEVKRRDDRYEDPVVADAWSLGGTHVGTLTPAACMYTAKYLQKDVVALEAQGPARNDGVGGSPGSPEFCVMSRKPALGRAFVERYWEDIYGDDFDAVVWDGVKIRPPRYYDRWLKENHPDVWKRISAKRLEERTEEASYRELFAREITKAKNAKFFAKERL